MGGGGYFRNGRSIRTFGGGGGAPPVRTAYFMACRLRRSSMISVSGRMFFFSQSPGGSTTDCAWVRKYVSFKGTVSRYRICIFFNGAASEECQKQQSTILDLHYINWQRGPCHLKEYLHYTAYKKIAYPKMCDISYVGKKKISIRGSVAKCLSSGFETAFPAHAGYSQLSSLNDMQYQQ
jgi:hypothetical protein